MLSDSIHRHFYNLNDKTMKVRTRSGIYRGMLAHQLEQKFEKQEIKQALKLKIIAQQKITHDQGNHRKVYISGSEINGDWLARLFTKSMEEIHKMVGVVRSEP